MRPRARFRPPTGEDRFISPNHGAAWDPVVHWLCCPASLLVTMGQGGSETLWIAKSCLQTGIQTAFNNKDGILGGGLSSMAKQEFKARNTEPCWIDLLSDLIVELKLLPLPPLSNQHMWWVPARTWSIGKAGRGCDVSPCQSLHLASSTLCSFLFRPAYPTRSVPGLVCVIGLTACGTGQWSFTYSFCFSSYLQYIINY